MDELYLYYEFENVKKIFIPPAISNDPIQIFGFINLSIKGINLLLFITLINTKSIGFRP